MKEFEDLKKQVMAHYNDDEMIGTTFESSVDVLIRGVHQGGRTTGQKEERNRIRALSAKVELPNGEIVYQIPVKEIDEPKGTEALWFKDSE